MFSEIIKRFTTACKRLILLDYDGTLVPFHCDPSRALPDESLMLLLEKISAIKDLELVIISGRHKDFLESVFHDLEATLFGEHGAVYRINGKWQAMKNDLSWKREISEIIGHYVVSTPFSAMEKKENSIVWHYRRADQELAESKIPGLIMKLTPPGDKYNLTIMKGRKIIEVKPSEYTKGTAILNFFNCEEYDFILAAGDDTTDEDLFEALPTSAITIHIGRSSALPGVHVRNSHDFVRFLETMINVKSQG